MTAMHDHRGNVEAIGDSTAGASAFHKYLPVELHRSISMHRLGRGLFAILGHDYLHMLIGPIILIFVWPRMSALGQKRTSAKRKRKEPVTGLTGSLGNACGLTSRQTHHSNDTQYRVCCFDADQTPTTGRFALTADIDEKFALGTFCWMS
jgi:hypothetical protein